jgi:RecA/RadA recombinase
MEKKMSTLNETAQTLLERFQSKNSEIFSESEFFNDEDFITTEVPLINIALSADAKGGLTSGITILAGESRTYKTCMSLKMVGAFLNKYEDGICLFYDSEFGTTNDYMESMGVDTSRVIHIPVEDIEQMKFDISKKLEGINIKDNIIIFIDSLGQIASKKEVEDAQNKKSVADMSRAKAIKSLFRIITPKLKLKKIPCIAVAHVYKDMGLFPKTIVGGGTGILYSANTVLVITKSQEKNGTELEGFTFNIRIDKSRFVKEGSRLPLTVMFDKGIEKHSGLLDLALEFKFIAKPSNGWYQKVNQETGELEGNKLRKEDVTPILDELLENKNFLESIKKKYKL